jgi:hypothetical protein
MSRIFRNSEAVAAVKAGWLTARKLEAISEVNRVVGKIRENYITSIPGQEMVYTAKQKEAMIYVTTLPESLDDLPFLKRESEELELTPWEVAQIWLYMAHYWQEIAAALEGKRVKGNQQIEACETESQVEAVLQDVLFSLTS